MNWLTKLARLFGWARCWGPNKHRDCPGRTWVRINSQREWPLCSNCKRWNWCELCGKWDPEEPPADLRAADPRVILNLCEPCSQSDKACGCGNALIKEEGVCWSCWDARPARSTGGGPVYTCNGVEFEDPFAYEDPFDQSRAPDAQDDALNYAAHEYGVRHCCSLDFGD